MKLQKCANEIENPKENTVAKAEVGMQKKPVESSLVVLFNGHEFLARAHSGTEFGGTGGPGIYGLEKNPGTAGIEVEFGHFARACPGH